MRIPSFTLSLLALPLLACASDPAIGQARRGDLPALGQTLDARAAAGKLDGSTIAAVAKATLEHDMERFAGDDGAARIESLAVCARAMKDDLARVADNDDELAAAAAMVLVSSDLSSVDRFTDAHRDDPRPRWRAVATRGLVGREEGALRAERAKSDDRFVRRAAIDAAGDAGCAGDFPLLLDAARHDPEAIVRVDAIRGLARIADRLDGDGVRADLVDRLNDLWKGGDDGVRGAVVRAWGAPALFPHGGERELQVVVGVDEGSVAVEAAASLMAAGSAEGEARLAILATKGEESVRVHAIRLLDPTRAAHLEVLAKTLVAPKEGPDRAVARELAAEAIARVPSKVALPAIGTADGDVRAQATATLKELSARKDRVGVDAAIALAESGDASMRARLLAELETASPMRVRVSTALVRLGHPEDVRKLLVDASLDVRDGVACAVLAAR